MKPIRQRVCCAVGMYGPMVIGVEILLLMFGVSSPEYQQLMRDWFPISLIVIAVAFIVPWNLVARSLKKCPDAC